MIAADHHSLRLQGDGQVHAKPDGTVWRAVWLRCDKEGVPLVSPSFVQEQTPLETAWIRPVRSKLHKPHAATPTRRGGSPVTSPKGVSHATSNMSPLRRSVEQLAHVMSAQAGQQAKRKKRPVEEPCLDVAITAEALKWTPPEDADQKLRHKWPLSAREDLDFSDFHRYLTSIKSLDESTAGTYVQKMQYFYGLVTINNEDEFTPHSGFFCGASHNKSGRAAREASHHAATVVTHKQSHDGCGALPRLPVADVPNEIQGVCETPVAAQSGNLRPSEAASEPRKRQLVRKEERPGRRSP